MRARVIALTAALAGCSGTIGGHGGGDPGGGGDDRGGSSGNQGGTGASSAADPGGGASGGSGVLAACGPGGGLTLRRLNRDEYDNTVRDLLGDDSRPARAFPADVSADGFDNHASTLTVPPLLAEAYDGAAEKLIEDAWARDVAAGPPATGRTLRTCDPASGAPCVRSILSGFAARAWRRPVTDDEVARLIALADVASSAGEARDGATKLALRAVLMSPSFLFRIERDADPKSALAPYALASRLSYFLWASMPDARLLQLAADRTLLKPDVLRAEARRMLDDPRGGKTIVEQLGAQWWDMRSVEGIAPDAKLFPEVTPSLKRAMRLETENLFRTLLTTKRSALDLVDADFTFLTQELAQHYALWDLNVQTSDPEQVKLVPAQHHRAGLLGHGGVLAVTSFPGRTSVVKRGVWVMRNLLCEEPPPPPADVPPLPAASAGAGATVRQRTEAHRTNPTCAACHKKIDPIGFGLERYDAIGRWREDDGGTAVDAKGELDGHTFDGPLELAATIKAQPAFEACIVQKAWTYALGRKPRDDERASFESLTAAFASAGHSLSDLLVELATSRAFVEPCGTAGP